MAKINLALICGGKSVEHEVSLISAKNVIAALDFNKYDLHLIAVTKKGAFRFYENYQNFLNNENDPNIVSLKEEGFMEVAWCSADPRGQVLLLSAKENQPAKFLKIEVVFPIMHGSFAEDGRMQGLLEMLDLPYVGPDVLASAISMDKEITKKLVELSGIKVARYLSFDANIRTAINFTEIKKEFGLPLFIKPANSGSSVGIDRVSDEMSFNEAVDQAFLVDHKVLIEEAIIGRELECPVLGNRDNLVAGEIGEIVPSSKYGFYSYDAKYLDESGAQLLIPAKIDPSKKREIQSIAKKVFAACQCEGMARVDFFMTKEGQVVFNEINTIPGFTKISMYPKLMMAETGMSYSALIDKLIALAMERHIRNAKILFEKKMVE